MTLQDRTIAAQTCHLDCSVSILLKPSQLRWLFNLNQAGLSLVKLVNFQKVACCPMVLKFNYSHLIYFPDSTEPIDSYVTLILLRNSSSVYIRSNLLTIPATQVFQVSSQFHRRTTSLLFYNSFELLTVDSYLILPTFLTTQAFDLTS